MQEVATVKHMSHVGVGDIAVDGKTTRVHPDDDTDRDKGIRTPERGS
jgi:hypothetical protein